MTEGCEVELLVVENDFTAETTLHLMWTNKTGGKKRVVIDMEKFAESFGTRIEDV